MVCTMSHRRLADLFLYAKETVKQDRTLTKATGIRAYARCFFSSAAKQSRSGKGPILFDPNELRSAAQVLLYEVLNLRAW